MTKRCHHEIEQKSDYPDDYICQKCQTIWTYKRGMPNVELMTFPLVVRRLILEKQVDANIGVLTENYCDLEA